MDNTAAAPGKQTRIHTVTITVDRSGKITSVTPDRLPISKSAQDEVIWETNTGEDFIVDFGGDSPFSESQFNQDNWVSGPVGRGVLADPDKYYKYTIRKAKSDPWDPGIIVNR